jgi:site-specific DNA recombinase
MNSKRNTKPAADSRHAIGYVRVSTPDQVLGIDAQRAALESWATRNGVELIGVYEDRGVSGGAAIDRRPGLMAALDALAGCGAGVLVVAKRDRLARDVLVAAMADRLVERSGARIVSADGVGEGSDPSAALLRGMVDLFASYERAMIRSRTVVALAQKRARGERTGTVPVGCRLAADGVHLEADPTEARIVAAVLEGRSAGLSLRGIVADLAERGMLTRRGGAVQTTQVVRILRRAA